VELLAPPMLMSALIGGAAGRWTRAHPLAIGLMVCLPGALVTTLLFAGLMSPAALVAGGMFGLVFWSCGAFGAFVGRLRRRHIERMN